MKENDARAESALKHVPEWNGEGWDNMPELQKRPTQNILTIKKLTEYLRTMIYYHHHPDRKNWDLIGDAEELVNVIEKGIYGNDEKIKDGE